ncbi:FtsK/SpoIIIE domain-containing protein [Actinoplanes sp. NPDC049668]|uniref:FtsK/SpoIIIE domain-containing protein n=1 Tax=unclassified Actinoplanes TaxID=2626549 RepID=UPI0033A86D95
MASIAQLLARAADLHRRAASYVLDAEAAVERLSGDEFDAATTDVAVRRLAEHLQGLARAGLPGWLSRPLNASTMGQALGSDAALSGPLWLKIGEAWPLRDAMFWAVAPFVGAGHLTIDTDARDRQVAAWLRGILLRTVAALPEGTVRVVPVDGAMLGAAFTAFRPLVDAEAWALPVTDLAGFRTALTEAEQHIATVQSGDQPQPAVLIIAVAAFPAGAGRNEWSRLAAIAHAGPACRVHLLLAGQPPALDNTTMITTLGDGWWRMSEPPGPQTLSTDRGGLPAPIRLDAGASEDVVAEVCRRMATTAAISRRTDFAALMPDPIWRRSSAAGLRAVAGRDARSPFTLSLDDATPHMLLAGRSGAGKTNVLLVLLYALASHYSPDELGLYLLDFKEGVSFVEFTPTVNDPSWVPHARTVGIESDREYGLAVLHTLSREMTRRAGALKAAGVTKLADLRQASPDVAMPRLVVVIDEFQVLFAGNDTLAHDAVAALEELARKGRSYGIHLILASQTIAGIEALYTKKDSIFGQFPLRIALPGGSGILDPGNTAADALPVGSAVVNASGGVAEANRIVRFPHADPASLAAQRHALWQARPPVNDPPSVFAGYAEHHITDDPLYQALTPSVRRRQALVGRAVDVGLPSVGFALDAVPGRHLATLGTSIIGADILHAAAMSLARQHQPGSARFVIGGFAANADPIVDDLVAHLTATGHDVVEADAGRLRELLSELADPDGPGRPTYLVLFAADVIVPLLSERGPNRQTGLDDLRTVLRQGPGRGIHMLSWWRIARRFSDATGGAAGREDIACLVALNVPGTELSSLLGDHTITWQSRANRALLLDRHDQRQRLIVPFVRPGRQEGLDEPN